MSNYRLRIGLAGLALLAVFAFRSDRTAMAQGPAPRPMAPAKPASPAAPQHASIPETPQGHELTAADVEAFLDGLIPTELKADDIAGAVVAVVKDGQPLFAKGYGYADVAKKTPVTPDGTLFRPGSISKLFTWTSVMQQVEAGKLDLDRDVNDYLDFRIPATYPKPITLRNLMTHTPGFEESFKNLILATNHIEPLGPYLAAHLPARIFAPGTIPAYSNYGAALAGYIVQRVSGQPFPEYVDEHIFKPLGMTHSTFVQPLPPNLKPLMSDGYVKASDPPHPFEVIWEAPAGALSTTAGDISHFMIAHLENGQYNGVAILHPETVELIHSRQFGLAPALNHMCLGFYESSLNGHRIIGHGGDTIYFHSELGLVLDSHVGLYVSYNSAGKGNLSDRSVLFEKFMDRYFPAPQPAEPALASAKIDARQVAGSYRTSRRSETTVVSMEAAFSAVKVNANPDGTITVAGLGSGSEFKNMREVGPLVFRSQKDESRVAFVRDAAGQPVLCFDFPAMVFQRTPWYKNATLNTVLFFGSLAVFVLAVLCWLFSAILRRHYGRPLELSPRERKARSLARAVCLIDAAFILAWIAFGSFAEQNLSLLSDSFDPWMRLIQLAGLIGVIGMFPVIYNSLRNWGNRERWFWSKAGETLIALACISLTFFIIDWHALALSLKY
ncbi:MAG TPA: serine hydrolase domain-containing protein [Terriglobia bacterium]|nr:serine hydrolase domain-containing protein [Terriglobia bacterium]